MFVLLDENGDAIASSDESIRFVNNQAVIGYKKPVFYIQYNELNSNIVERDYFDSATELANKKSELISKFQADLNDNAMDIASAIAEDGINEDSNVDAFRVERSAIKSKFQSDMIALIARGVN